MNSIMKNWNFRRIMYIIGGLFFVLIAIKDRSWWMIPVGLYFVGMGIFRFGCASGNCNLPVPEDKTSN